MSFALGTQYNSFEVDKKYPLHTTNIDLSIEKVTNSLAHSTESVLHNSELLEELIETTHAFPQLDEAHRKQWAYILCSSFSNVCHHGKALMELTDYSDSVDNLKMELERFGYLIFVLLSFLAKEDFMLSSVSGRQKQTSTKWRNNCSQVEEALDVVTTCLKLPLSRIFVTTPERIQFLEMLIRPIFHLMELPDRMKLPAVKTLMFRDVALAVVNHSMSSVAQNSIMQTLTYYVHSPPYMAELLHILHSQYDHIALTEELLRELSLLEFNSNDTNGPKAISEFLVKLSELSPRLILKQMSSTAQLLDNSHMSLRCSVVEACGNIVVDILKTEFQEQGVSDDLTANSALQADGLLNLLEERFLDQNPFVRTKAIQAMVKVCVLPIKIPKRKQLVMLIAVRSLADRSTLVRRNAIKLMYKILLSHPFLAVHGTQLNYDAWKKRLDDAEADLRKLIPQLAPMSMADENADPDDDMDIEDEADKSLLLEQALATEAGAEDDGIDINPSSSNVLPEAATIVKAKLLVKYYEEALEFIEAVQNGTTIASELLFSKNRNEVLESMDFLVLADAHGIKNASDGIRRMLHLVWMKGSSDEGKSISSHLIDCYKDLFLTAPPNVNTAQASALSARNLIGLTIDATVADLASLEKLLCYMYEARLINSEVIKVLWQIYTRAGSGDTTYSKNFVHGSIQILGMLALADHMVVQMGIDSLLSVGLGSHGKSDLILCKYTCVALLRALPPQARLTDSNKFHKDDAVLSGLRELLLLYSDSSEWYGVAEQSLDAIYKLSPSPEEICSDVIAVRTEDIFGDMENGGRQVTSLSQLLFIVGHVAIKTIAYLETLEAQFKKRKHEGEVKKANADKDSDENELEMIGGTSEDDFTDAVIYIKERELLHGESSLLARFGPLVREICLSRDEYDNDNLQRSAVLCLAKLMCVSSKFCEENLPMIITIMEKSKDPIIRSNCVLGLGDMAVCFNNLVDENTDFLYRRLNDENIMVQRTCLMTVTFLILAGQVKVKGQLSSMAKCLEHLDQGIRDMCKLFFTELATKDNAIYNGFIDIFSGLSHDKTLKKDGMRRIVKFLVGFIEKEKHQKQLADKLLNRLIKSSTNSEWEDISYVLSVIPYKNEAITQAIEAGFTMVLARD